MAFHQLQIGDLQLGCSDVGTGPPVVLIHGFPFDHSMWQGQINALSPQFRVLAPDLRGFGKSTLAAEDVADGIGMEVFAADVLAILDHLEVSEPVILCGFSMGGYVAWQFVLHFPRRANALVLCDTRAVADTSEARAGRLQMAQDVLQTGTEPIIEAMLPKLLSPATLESRPSLVRQVRAMIGSCSPQAITAALRGMARRSDVTDELPHIQHPALLLCGEHDAISTAAEMRGIATELPTARFSEIPQAGHLAPLENAEICNSEIQRFTEGLA